MIGFVIGLILVSVIKNETRNRVLGMGLGNPASEWTDVEEPYKQVPN